MKGLTFDKVRYQFPNIFKGERLNKKEKDFVVKQYETYFLPYYKQAEKVKQLDYRVEDIVGQDFTAVMTPFYCVMNKKSCGRAWKERKFK